MSGYDYDAIRKQELVGKYMALCHAMQSGVAYHLPKDPSGGTPKHLRTGVNSALVNDCAVATLLMEKGIFTELEYFEALVVAMTAEVANYETLLSEIYGTKITLG